MKDESGIFSGGDFHDRYMLRQGFAGQEDPKKGKGKGGFLTANEILFSNE